MTLLPVAQPAPPAPVPVDGPPTRAERRRARRRLRLERSLVLLSLPAAVAATVAVLLFPPSETAVAAPRVAVVGALTPAAAARLGSGVVVVDVARDARRPSTTQVAFYSEADRVRAAQVRDRLGVGTLVLGRARPAGADLTITVGKDLDRE